MTPITNYQHPNELLSTVNAAYVVDLLDLARHVDYDSFKEGLIYPTEGMYLGNDLKPMISNSVTYYIVRNGTLVPVTDMDKCLSVPETLFDSNNNVVIEASKLHACKNLLKPHPSYISIIANVIGIMVLNDISDLCRYSKFLSIPSLSNYILPEYEDKIVSNIEYVCAYLFNDIQVFVGADTWSMYFKRFKRNLLVVEKSVDYRIYDWHMIQYQKQLELEGGGYVDY